MAAAICCPDAVIGKEMVPATCLVMARSRQARSPALGGPTEIANATREVGRTGVSTTVDI
jgi:hypothetical protein